MSAHKFWDFKAIGLNLPISVEDIINMRGICHMPKEEFSNLLETSKLSLEELKLCRNIRRKALNRVSILVFLINVLLVYLLLEVFSIQQALIRNNTFINFLGISLPT